MTSLLNKEDDNNKVIQALEKEKLFGAAVAMTPLRNDVKYRSILKEEFNAALKNKDYYELVNQGMKVVFKGISFHIFML